MHNWAVCDVAVGTRKKALLAQRGQRLRWQVLCYGQTGLKTEPVSLTCFQTWDGDQSHPKSQSLLDSAHPIYHLLPCPRPCPHCPESYSALGPNQPHWAPHRHDPHQVSLLGQQPCLPHPSALSPPKEHMSPGPRAGLQWSLQISGEFYADSIVGNLRLACAQHGCVRLGPSLVFEFSPVFRVRGDQCL